MTMAANMKGFTKRTWVLGLLAAGSLLSAQAQADQLADIKAAGVVKVATFDANPPFGSIDAKTHEIVGYDVDFAKALAKSLGVKLELVATNPANRIPSAAAVRKSRSDRGGYNHHPGTRTGD